MKDTLHYTTPAIGFVVFTLALAALFVYGVSIP